MAARAYRVGHSGRPDLFTDVFDVKDDVIIQNMNKIWIFNHIHSFKYLTKKLALLTYLLRTIC